MASINRSNTVSIPTKSSPSHSDSFIRLRQPSLDLERDILSTRGQRLAGLIRRRSLSLYDSDGFEESDLWDESNTPRDRIDRPAFERAKRLIGDRSPLYRWQSFYRHPATLQGLPKPLRQYYERNNDLISQYAYIDRLLGSSLPHRLIVDYHKPRGLREATSAYPNNGDTHEIGSSTTADNGIDSSNDTAKVKRTPRNLYRIPDEGTPLLSPPLEEDVSSPPNLTLKHDDFVESGDRIVIIAIYVNFIANMILLAAKIVVMSMTSSLSVLASLVDAALDFLSTAIVWVTTTLISRQDRYRYPISRRRLEPLSVLVFAVVMVTSFVQVALTSFSRLLSTDHSVIELTVPSIAVMASTVVIKLICWFWCRLIKNSSVQALAQDAMTDVVFNLASILFPLIGSFTNTWFIDPLGGVLLSLYVIWNWSGTASEHIGHLTGAAASPKDHSILLYMTMRFSKAILKIQDLKAYYAGDKLNVEIDIVLEPKTRLQDSHDVGESLQYMIESVPTVDRAFVHLDYDPWNIPSHMNQQEA
ncbi:cation diffusion facilitator family transporter [Aspergillus saccharolyticus JOP 1030-1]|uniref:Cation diffusion facilitator n=1 Tax=Aspergillus saccharolyticus JOP 1030-1 TaxID=1450539 RepID=A0A318ZDR1_9EURO|nr:cation diffusion facilitator [Aspergillus saccharolyticus JOP 1030-1]PYH45499.1 cation diffusion facilitator [Aspergillus saccharolyticus JOP 1030-1]